MDRIAKTEQKIKDIVCKHLQRLESSSVVQDG